MIASAGKFVHAGERQRQNAPGDELGEVTLEDGSKVDAGRALFKGTWNAALHEHLAASFDESQNSHLPDDNNTYINLPLFLIYNTSSSLYILIKCLRLLFIFLAFNYSYILYLKKLSFQST